MAKNTHQIIMTEFTKMLEEMVFDKITVSELVRRCNISPNTFYYHYGDIYQLLGDWFNDGFKEYQANNSDLGDWRKVVKDLLCICRKHPEIIFHIYYSLSRESLERFVFLSSSDIVTIALKQNFGDKIPENKFNIIASSLKYSLLGFFLHFIWNKMNDDIDESVEMLSDMFQDVIDAEINKNKRTVYF